MTSHSKVCSLIRGEELVSVEPMLNELDLGLTTVQDVIDRNVDSGSAEDSYIGVNLGLYVQHTEGVVRRLREFLAPEGGARP